MNEPKILARFGYVDAALFCPDLWMYAWKHLAAAYRGRPQVRAIVLDISSLDDGSMEMTNCVIFKKRKRLHESDPMKWTMHPFGKGPEAPSKAAEYAAKKTEEIKTMESEVRSDGRSTPPRGMLPQFLTDM